MSFLVDVVTPPIIYPLTLQEVKDFLRVSHDEEDNLISMMLAVATELAEKILNRSLTPRTLRYYSDQFPVGQIELPYSPISSITSVQYLDANGDLQTFATDQYQISAVGGYRRIAPIPGGVWPPVPSSTYDSVQITYVAGYATRDLIPAPIRQGILYHLSHLYDIREPVIVAASVAQVPFSIQQMYAPYRVNVFG